MINVVEYILEKTHRYNNLVGPGYAGSAFILQALCMLPRKIEWDAQVKLDKLEYAIKCEVATARAAAQIYDARYS